MVSIEGLGRGTSLWVQIVYLLSNPLIMLKIIMFITEIGMFFYGVTGGLFAYKLKKRTQNRKWKKVLLVRKRRQSLLNRFKSIIFNLDTDEYLFKRYGYKFQEMNIFRKLYLELYWRFLMPLHIKNPYFKRFWRWFLVWFCCKIIYYILVWKWFPFKAWHMQRIPKEYFRIFWKLWDFFYVVILKQIKLKSKGLWKFVRKCYGTIKELIMWLLGRY